MLYPYRSSLVGVQADIVFLKELPASLNGIHIGFHPVFYCRDSRHDSYHLIVVGGVDTTMRLDEREGAKAVDVAIGVVLNGRSIAVNHLLDSHISAQEVGVEQHEYCAVAVVEALKLLEGSVG